MADLPGSPPLSVEMEKSSVGKRSNVSFALNVYFQKPKFTRKTPVIAKGSETNGNTSDSDGHLLGSLVKAGLLDHVVQSARKRRKKAQEEVATYAKDIKGREKKFSQFFLIEWGL